MLKLSITDVSTLKTSNPSLQNSDQLLIKKNE